MRNDASKLVGRFAIQMYDDWSIGLVSDCPNKPQQLAGHLVRNYEVTDGHAGVPVTHEQEMSRPLRSP
jgi:hypothetical protein